MIRPDRLKRLFLDLVAIDSVSKHEGRLAARLVEELRDLGATIAFDRAGEAVGGEIHTTNEWVRVSDMVAAAEVTLATLEVAAAAR